MELKNKNRRGATLAELAVVIAVVAIVAVMVTSFIVMLDGSRDLSEMKLEALQDIRLAESVIEGYIVNGVNEGKTVNYLSEQMLSINTTENINTTTIKFTGGFLFVTHNFEGESNVVLELQTVKSITFPDPLVDTATGDAIYYCTITYDIGGTEFNYTFCVNPYAGENIGG